jgi:uncharacterized membrane protein YedE/YeeE
MKVVTALLVGLLFGLGLILSGMTDPGKVLGFLDLAGAWDPSLAFVMGGAVAVGSLTFPFATKRSKSLLGDAIRLPTAAQVDRRLVLGGLTFGVGWGLAGYCPGPVIASLVYGGIKPGLFVISMLVGMAVFELRERAKRKMLRKLLSRRSASQSLR